MSSRGDACRADRSLLPDEGTVVDLQITPPRMNHLTAGPRLEYHESQTQWT